MLEDLPSESFGRIVRLWFGNDQGLAVRTFAELKPAEQNTVANLVEGLRLQLHQVLEYARGGGSVRGDMRKRDLRPPP